MKIEQKKISAQGIKFILIEKNKGIGYGFLYLMKNDTHDLPFGLIESVFINEEYRGKGLGTELLNKMIAVAKKKCYKLILTCRNSKPKVQALYAKLGFVDWGKEYRIDFGVKSKKNKV